MEMNRNDIDFLRKVEETIRLTHETLERTNRSVLQKYPLTFALLGTVGVAAVIHGFERIVDMTPILADRPILIFISGLVILFATGGLYRYLQK